jgi:hypothetical protein
MISGIIAKMKQRTLGHDFINRLGEGGVSNFNGLKLSLVVIYFVPLTSD